MIKTVFYRQPDDANPSYDRIAWDKIGNFCNLKFIDIREPTELEMYELLPCIQPHELYLSLLGSTLTELFMHNIHNEYVYDAVNDNIAYLITLHTLKPMRRRNSIIADILDQPVFGGLGSINTHKNIWSKDAVQTMLHLLLINNMCSRIETQRKWSTLYIKIPSKLFYASTLYTNLLRW